MSQTQKPGRPTDAKPDEWQLGMNPQSMAGRNIALEEPHPEKEAPTA